MTVGGGAESDEFQRHAEDLTVLNTLAEPDHDVLAAASRLLGV